MNKSLLKKISKVINTDLGAVDQFYGKIMSIKRITPTLNHWEIFKIAIYKMCPDLSGKSTVNISEAVEYINNSITRNGKNSAVEYNDLELKKRLQDGVIRSITTEDGLDTLGRKKISYQIYLEDVINFCLLMNISGIAEKVGFLENNILPGAKSVSRNFYISSQASRNGISRTDSYAQATILLMKEKKVLDFLTQAISEVESK